MSIDLVERQGYEPKAIKKLKEKQKKHGELEQNQDDECKAENAAKAKAVRD